MNELPAAGDPSAVMPVGRRPCDEERARATHGWAELVPADPAVAASFGTWALVYHVGGWGIDDGGTIKVAWPSVSDWGTPQTDKPWAPNYLTVRADGEASLAARFDAKAYVRPFNKAVVVDVFDASLAPGETVTITYGDRSAGSPGAQAQTFAEEALEFRVAVDPFGANVFEELRPSPTLAIVHGPPARLVAVAPSTVAPGESLLVTVRVEDAWGNPCLDYDSEVALVHDQCEGVEPQPAADGLRSFLVRFRVPGVYRLEVRSGELVVETNPILCEEGAFDSHAFWGDLHGQTEETAGRRSARSYFEYARDYARLDFVGHQGNDFQITQRFWRDLKALAREFNAPGRFVTLLGFEWSGISSAGGDRNVHFLDDDARLRRTCHLQVPDRSDEGDDCYPVSELFGRLREDAGVGKGGTPRVLVIPHVGGRPCNLAFHDPELEPLVEIYSSWGEFEWLIRDAIEQKCVVGFSAGSDDHTCRPGATRRGSERFTVYGGLTCTYAEELTREALFEALRERRCIATTGERILLRFRADGRPLGSVLEASTPPSFEVEAFGTADIEKVEIFKGTECVFAHPKPMPRSHNTVRVSWSGARIKGRARNVSWDGGLEVEGGTIVDARGYAFDTPDERLSDRSRTSIRWRSVTGGDADGVIVALEAADSARLHLETPLLRRSVSLAEVRERPVVVELGGIDLRVVFEMLPIGAGAKDLLVSFRDVSVPATRTAYWARLTQMDGAKAWASPIFVSSR